MQAYGSDQQVKIACSAGNNDGGTYGKSESKFSVYAYDGITLSDYH